MCTSSTISFGVSVVVDAPSGTYSAWIVRMEDDGSAEYLWGGLGSLGAALLDTMYAFRDCLEGALIEQLELFP